MALVTKNLGQVGGIVHTTSEPVNKKIIWWDESPGENVPKIYNFSTSQWEEISSGGGGASSFLDLTDVSISSYSGHAGSVLRVATDESGVEPISFTATDQYYGTNSFGLIGVHSLPAGGGGASAFVDLTDVEIPALNAFANGMLRINAAGDKIEAFNFTGNNKYIGTNASGIFGQFTLPSNFWTSSLGTLTPVPGINKLQIFSPDTSSSGIFEVTNSDLNISNEDEINFSINSVIQAEISPNEFSLYNLGVLEHNIAGGSNNSYLYANGDGFLGIGTTTPSEKLTVFNGNIGVEVEDATSGSTLDTVKFGYLKLQSSFYNTSASGGPASQDVLLYVKNVPTQSLGNPAVSASNFSISRLETSTTVNNDLLRIDTSSSHYVFGANNTVTSPQSTFIFGTSCQGTTGVNQYAFGKVLKISGTDTFMTGSGYSAYTETRGGMRGHIFSVTAASRRVNFEYGINIPMRLLPQQARSTGLQFDNQGFHLISSYWDGSASQDITGYINHIITSQPNGEGALTLGNKDNDKSFIIDANNAVRINEQLHGMSLLTAPSQTALNVYSIPGSSEEMVKFIQPVGSTNNRVALVNDINSKLTFELRGSTASDPGAAKITLSGSGELRLEPPANFNLRIVLPAGTGNLVVDRIGGSTETLNTV